MIYIEVFLIKTKPDNKQSTPGKRKLDFNINFFWGRVGGTNEE